MPRNGLGFDCRVARRFSRADDRAQQLSRAEPCSLISHAESTSWPDRFSDVSSCSSDANVAQLRRRDMIASKDEAAELEERVRLPDSSFVRNGDGNLAYIHLVIAQIRASNR